MVCRDFILPEPASYVFFYAVFNLRNLLYIIPCLRLTLPTAERVVVFHHLVVAHAGRTRKAVVFRMERHRFMSTVF